PPPALHSLPTRRSSDLPSLILQFPWLALLRFTDSCYFSPGWGCSELLFTARVREMKTQGDEGSISSPSSLPFHTKRPTKSFVCYYLTLNRSLQFHCHILHHAQTGKKPKGD